MSRILSSSVIGAAFTLCLALPSLAHAATHHVGPNQIPTIQGALAIAANGDLVLVQPGNYGPIDFLGKNVEVRSTDGPSQTFINGGGVDSGVKFEDSESASAILDGFTIYNGSNSAGGGGVRIYAASPTLRNLVIEGNEADVGFAGGGGIYAYQSQSLMTNLVVSGNSAGSGGGGGIALRGGSDVSIESSTISGNLVSTNFQGSGRGGGLWIRGASRADIVDSIIWGNEFDFAFEDNELIQIGLYC